MRLYCPTCLWLCSGKHIEGLSGKAFSHLRTEGDLLHWTMLVK